MSSAAQAQRRVPFSVMLATTLIVLNGVIAVALAAAWATSNNWHSFHWSLLRLFAAGAVGLGLMRLAPWAWKWGVYGGLFYVLSGVLNAVALRYLQMRGWAKGGQDDVVFMMLGALLLVVAIACLCGFQSRAAFDAQDTMEANQPPPHEDLRPPIPPPY